VDKPEFVDYASFLGETELRKWRRLHCVLLVVGGLLAAPLALFVSLMHINIESDAFPTIAVSLFPTAFCFWLLFSRGAAGGAIVLLMAIGQMPLYGAVLAFALWKRRIWTVLIIMITIHVSALIACVLSWPSR
jgi:hypothetical protein